ncbi:MAG: thioredoxin family protein [Bacteroidetes bacterium]|nr:thioredoxin family protein [Bacteroidota bacterium]
MRTLLLPVTLLFLLLHASCGGRGDEAAHETPSASIITELDMKSFGSFLASGTTTIVQFGGKRCLPCMEMRSILTEIGMEHPDVRIGIVFWEDSPELFAEWNITVIPARIMFDEAGNEHSRHRGTSSKDEILAELQHLRLQK